MNICMQVFAHFLIWCYSVWSLPFVPNTCPSLADPGFKKPTTFSFPIEPSLLSCYIISVLIVCVAQLTVWHTNDMFGQIFILLLIFNVLCMFIWALTWCHTMMFFLSSSLRHLPCGSVNFCVCIFGFLTIKHGRSSLIEAEINSHVLQLAHSVDYRM